YMFSFKEIFTSRTTLVAMLIMLFPLFINTLRHWASSIYILVFLLSVTAVRQYRFDLKKEEKIFLAILLLHVLTVVASNILAGWTYASNRWFFAGEVRLLLAIPVYLYIRQIPGIWRWLLRGIPLGAIIIGLTGIIDFAMRYYKGDVGMIFAEGIYGHIFQGNIAALLSVLSFLAIDYFKDNKLFMRLCIAGAMLAFLGALVSVTRNAWLSLIVLYAATFIISNSTSSYLATLKLKHYLTALVILLPVLYFLANIEYVKDRFERIVEEPVVYFNIDRSQPIPFTSIGFRLEQWRGVLLAVQEKPLLGHGVGNMGRLQNDYVEQGKLNQLVYMDHTEKTGRPTHVHSAYFEYLGDTGVIGFTLTLLMLFYPMYAALKKRKQSNVAWRFVFIHYFAFAVASLTEVPFIRNNWTSVFLIFAMVFFAWLVSESADEEKRIQLDAN
ncbi:MAG: O-antigen ligase family protein, partial [Gammaproteobacteria bacterium]